MTSLPVPLSPVIRMETSLGATRSTVRTTACITGLWKTGEEPAAHRGQRAAQRAVFLVLLLVLQSALNGDQQALRVEGLVQEVIRAPFGGFDRSLKSRIAGQDDHLSFRPSLLDLGKQIQTVGVRQFDVEKHDVRLRFRKSLFEGSAAFRFGDFVTFAQNVGEEFADVRGVINNQYFALHSFFLRCNTHACVKA